MEHENIDIKQEFGRYGVVANGINYSLEDMPISDAACHQCEFFSGFNRGDNELREKLCALMRGSHCDYRKMEGRQMVYVTKN